MAFNAMHSQKYYPQVAGHNGLFFERLLELVAMHATRGAIGTHYTTLTWTAKEGGGARQIAFAKKLEKYPEIEGMETSFTPDNHTGLGPDELAMGAPISVKRQQSKGVFRERA